MVPSDLKQDEEGPNLFILRTIAASQILQSSKLESFTSNPYSSGINWGEKIAVKFCQYFSKMMENLR